MSKSHKTVIKKLEMSLKGIDGHLAYSNEEVVAYYSLGTSNFDFLDSSEKERLALTMDRALGALITNQTKTVEAMIVMTSSPLNVEKWARDWSARVRQWDPREGFNKWMFEMKNHLGNAYYAQKEVYLAVVIGKRTEYRDSGAGGDALTGALKSAVSMISQSVGSFMGVTGHEITNQEREYWINKARDTDRILESGGFRATKVQAYSIAELYKRTLFPAMPTPELVVKDQQVWGEGELSTLTPSYIQKKRKYVRIIQTDEYGDEMEGFKATLSFAQFPDVIPFPDAPAWMHYISRLPTHFDIYSRFTLVPAQKVKKAITQKIKTINDEADNAAKAGSVPMSLRERHGVATDLQYELDNSREPWVFGRHRVVVTARTESELKDNVTKLQQHYADMEIVLEWSTGDQFDLLLESQPADKVRSRAFMQRQSISVISGGMPTANSSVGD